jgi:hypothetical protein
VRVQEIIQTVTVSPGVSVQRRSFLKSSLGILAANALRHTDTMRAATTNDQTAPFFSTEGRRWQEAYDKAIGILAANVQVMPRYDKPVLIEGSDYAGVWQECGPHEALVYRHFRPDVARNDQMTFFVLQRPDGQLPASNKRTQAGFGQIQMVVPIAATAWELASATDDSELLETAYHSCSRWDEWLMRYRNTRGTGLVEGFCTYDTGMDNSPRWAGIPRQCPDADARLCPALPTMPRLCPDLSATVYGGRVALASMATALGRKSEADAWRERAETIRRLIVERLYVPEDAAFYDLDATDHFVRVRSDILLRICSEHVVDQKIFDAMWSQQLGNPQAFWAPFPFPSSALNDPTFVRPIPRNSWGGASQALTALRTGRWMDHYGRSAEFAHLMEQWCEAMQRDMSFRQQLDPLTGTFSEGDLPNYSPACLVLYDFTWRLAGVREEKSGLHWTVRPGIAVSDKAQFRLTLRTGTATMRYTARSARLTLGGRELGEIEGTARLITDSKGTPLSVVGVSQTKQDVVLRLAGLPHRRITLMPNQIVLLS